MADYDAFSRCYDRFTEDVDYSLRVNRLLQLFEKNVLCSPAKFKQRIRAERGEELLRGTDLTVDEIANQVGFNSTAHFRKVFESRFHLSPSEIRKKYKKN